MKLIVALGNPGPDYEKTRHNTAWQVINKLDLHWVKKARFDSLIAEETRNNEKILFVKPLSFYNQTGQVVRKIMDFYQIDTSDMLAIHDDLSLMLGTVRTRIGGSDAGNNGIKSLNLHCGSDFARIRVGINTVDRRTNDVDFVLTKFSQTEEKQLSKLTPDILALIDAFCTNNFTSTTLSLPDNDKN